VTNNFIICRIALPVSSGSLLHFEERPMLKSEGVDHVVNTRVLITSENKP
jgi:hypothetical protein